MRPLRYFGIFAIFTVLLHIQLNGHGLARALMYDSDKVYKEKGLKKPDLGDDLIAIIGDRKFTKKEYKDWLHQKISYNPEMREDYRVDRCLTEYLKAKGYELEKRGAQFKKYLYQMTAYNKIYKTRDEWITDSKNYHPSQSKFAEDDWFTLRSRFQDYFLPSLYLIHEWKKYYKAFLKEKGYDASALNLKEDDEVSELVQMNNAYFMTQLYMSYIKPDIKKAAYAKKFESFGPDNKDYVEWLYKTQQTELHTENFLAMYLVEKKAKELRVMVTEEAVSKLFDERRKQHEKTVKQFSEDLSKIGHSVSVDKSYYESLKRETCIDLLGSRQYRVRNPQTYYEMKKVFYETYGYNGMKAKVEEVFKWIRKRRTKEKTEAFDEYVKLERHRVIEGLKRLREKILKKGVQSFPEYAIVENDILAQQLACGYVENPSTILGDELMSKLTALKLNEISDVLLTPGDKAALIWVVKGEGENRKYYMISKKLPGRLVFDAVAYQQELDSKRKQLKEIMAKIKGGALMGDMAKKYSDSYRRQGVDISDAYQKKYGYSFAKEIDQLKEGELSIINSAKGLHLVRVNEILRTKYGEKVKIGIVDSYKTSLATDDELNALSEELLYEFDPYF